MPLKATCSLLQPVAMSSSAAGLLPVILGYWKLLGLEPITLSSAHNPKPQALLTYCQLMMETQIKSWRLTGLERLTGLRLAELLSRLCSGRRKGTSHPHLLMQPRIPVIAT